MREVPGGPKSGSLVLSDSYVVVVTNRVGAVDLHLFTADHVDGSNGRHYHSECVHGLARALVHKAQ